MTEIQPKNYVLIVAAGRGYRAGGELPKQYCLLAGKPVIRYSAESFTQNENISNIYVVIHPDDKELYERSLKGIDYTAVIGGKERQDSVRLGLGAISSVAEDNDSVLIHDAARPFLSDELITNCLNELDTNTAVIPALPVIDTTKSIDSNGHVVNTFDRSTLRHIQTPQAFKFSTIYKAHQKAKGQMLTDDASVVEHSEIAVKVIDGDPNNIKITTADDFLNSERKIAMASEHQQIKYPQMATGFDVHSFETGDHVTLCGVNIAHTAALKGHSDADVAMHALTDALLGCISAGDIGSHFPASDPKWKGVASEVFLSHARDLIGKEGGIINHVDVTIICEAPKLGIHRLAMRESLAVILDLPLKKVSVKATTTEKLGFTGRNEGIAAQAAATILI